MPILEESIKKKTLYAITRSTENSPLICRTNFRKTNSERINFNFHLGNRHIDVYETYKYLGIILNEYIDYTETANALNESAGRAFSSLIVNLYNKMDLLYSSYTKVYECNLVPIMDYSSSVW